MSIKVISSAEGHSLQVQHPNKFDHKACDPDTPQISQVNADLLYHITHANELYTLAYILGF